MKINPDAKCVIVHKNTTECLLVESMQSGQTPVYRLPLARELNPNFFSEAEVKMVTPEVLLVFTPIDWSPWDLFDPFPPADFVDWGYLDLLQKSGFSTTKYPNGKKVVRSYWSLIQPEEQKYLLQVAQHIRLALKTAIL